LGLVICHAVGKASVPCRAVGKASVPCRAVGKASVPCHAVGKASVPCHAEYFLTGLVALLGSGRKASDSNQIQIRFLSGKTITI
jgi:hypothetical protein